MKNLIQCPSCEQQDRRQILGEIDSNGHFLVLRFHKGITRIIGNDFEVVCDLCQEPIYYKKGGNRGTMSNYGFKWVRRFSFGTALGTAGV